MGTFKSVLVVLMMSVSFIGCFIATHDPYAPAAAVTTTTGADLRSDAGSTTTTSKPKSMPRPTRPASVPMDLTDLSQDVR